MDDRFSSKSIAVCISLRMMMCCPIIDSELIGPERNGYDPLDVKICQEVYIPYTSWCFAQCLYSYSPGFGRSNRLPMTGFRGGPGGREGLV